VLTLSTIPQVLPVGNINAAEQLLWISPTRREILTVAVQLTANSQRQRRAKPGRKPMRRMISVTVATLLLVSAGGAGATWTWPPSEEVAEKVETNLSRHYETDKLSAYLEEADAEHREALEFLLA